MAIGGKDLAAPPEGAASAGEAGERGRVAGGPAAGPGRALFLSGIDGFCHRYGVLHRAHSVASAGYEVEIRHFLDPRLPVDLKQTELVFLYRVPATRRLLELLPRFRARAGRLIGLVDDLIFIDDEECLPVHLETGKERERWLEGARRYRMLLGICDTVLAATPRLQQELHGLGMESGLHADSLSAEEFGLADTARASAARGDAEVVRLGYFSGTATHARDFEAAATGIRQAMDADSRLRLSLRGPLALPRELAAHEDRIDRAPLVGWAELPALVAAVDINLAPLAWQTRFARAKGATKFMEAGAVCVPTIASPTPAHEAAIHSGDNGILAGNPAAFGEAILALAADADLRAALGRAARATVETEFAPKVRVAEMQQLLAEALSEPAAMRTAPAPTGAAGSVGEREARIALEPDAFPTLPEAPVLAESPPLSDGIVLTQSFRVCTAGLFRLDLSTITFDQTLRHRLQFTLCDQAGNVLADETVDAADLPDRRYFAFTFAAREEGGEFRLELRAEGTGPGNAVSFGLTAQRGETPCARLGDVEFAGPLAIRAFAGWRFRPA